MPTRGSRSRGGSRGGSTRGGARGGGSFRNFKLSKSSKRRANKNKAAAHGHHESPELMDLGSNIYLPEVGSSMNSLSKRPNRRLMAEAQFTDKHMAETMSQPLRYRPVEFVKAQSVYDPGRELVEQLKKYEHKDDLSLNMESLNVSPESHQLSNSKPGNEDLNTNVTHRQNEMEVVDAVTREEDSDNSPAMQPETSPDSAALQDNLEGSMVGIVSEYIEDKRILDESNIPEALRADFFTQNAPMVERYDEIASKEELDRGNSPDIFVGSDESNHEEGIFDQSEIGEFFTIDEDGDDSLMTRHSVEKKSTSSLLKNEYQRSKIKKQEYSFETRQPNSTHDTSASIEHDPYFAVGRVMLKTSTDNYGNVTTNLPCATKATKERSSDFSDSYYGEESEETDEEAAFEDYKAHIMGDFNFGDEDSGQSDIMGEHADLDGVESFDYGEANACSDNDEILEEMDDFDVYISSDNLENVDLSDVDSGDLNPEEEGLEDILSFARSQQKMKNIFEVPSTETLKKKGKGKKQRLELGSHLELELRESLMEQFQYQRQSKKDKKLRKKEKRQREGVELHDLTIKYDYSLHIQEIKKEFEAFLHDAGRETISFPPLDSHGNKTINKLAGHYNMKCIRCGGNGIKLYMKVAKTKKTFRYVPAYNQILYITRQRPVFKRVDVKPRTEEEIVSTDGKKTKHGPQGSAIVQEGDIVGGKAPEIGNNNIGRQLLERLGWVRGEGLGALGNKGISEPLTATVKRSKTGLK